MERLTGLDASFLYLETGTQHLHVCALLILDPTAEGADYSFDAFKAELGRRLAYVPQMRRRLRQVPLNLDHPLWVEDADFDLDYHIRRYGLPRPGGRKELAELVGDIASTPMDRSRPLWQMSVVEGVDGDKVAVISKYHHAAVDGITGANMMMHLCDFEPGATRTEAPEPPDAHRPPRPEPQPSDWRLLADAAVRLPARAGVVGMLPKTVGMLAGFVMRRRATDMPGMAIPLTAPRTPFNKAITPHRTVAFTATDLDTVKEIKEAFAVKVNDVVLAAVGGALRRYLERRGELPDRSLIASVPVSVHESSRHTEGINKVSSLFCELGTDIADPVERLSKVAEANKGAKDEHELIGSDFLQDWTQYAPPNTFRLAMRLYSSFKLAERHPVVHNLVVSNVPGPPMPLYFLGVKVLGIYPFGPVFHGAGLTITALSNNGHLDFGLIACKELVPDVHELANEIPDALEELRQAARQRG
ncbi:wax ester/triacylglycerol synthase family O-acyltransferase [Nocardia farcinica]|uniref:WS/DGAT/MGAT family O-acyltransferase n=1 Tax=Nocardia farcinica TaxID=37329 RepID=UPI001893B89C|nr:wax ester/triacylglycerol synthase family O-acyltransferase [Nocardia farcinica]MBF6068168.1 wax ester/triacylglycerol synthase family O-acyltransferase [Nocardia farcinica]MBF6231711.1 wax ester/triacylglycerol synthase family O-acyltransferase [Nocardia farcinica]MBF6252080.1 wax ester/triacylglycerol synthase family O-acyltransferase [Nocardia farcinica]MBF6259142.1 wax ester/triacylglycerol synthase family O-acyltransferase [Nocardia farcinica]MBF6263373.1 wax ester/triacylglycerol synt